MKSIKIVLARTARAQRIRALALTLYALWGMWSISDLPRGSLFGMALALSFLAALFWAIGSFILTLDRQDYESYARRVRGD